MEEKRNRWVVNAILIMAVVALVGVSMLPLINGIWGAGEPIAQTTPTPTPAVAGARQTELETQARGYELVLQREPENQTALRGLVEARLQLQDIKGVIAPLEKLSKLNPTETRFAVLLAQAKQYSGDPEGAAQAYRTILTSHPGEVNALQGLVALLLDQNRPEAAVGLLQDTLKSAPQANQVQPGSVDVTSVQLLLGQVYADQKRYEEALAVYDQATQANQQDFRPVLAKAIVLKDQGKTEASKPLFTKAVTLAPAQYKDQINQLASGAAPGQTTPAPTPGVTPVNPAPSSSVTPTPETPAPAPAPAE